MSTAINPSLRYFIKRPRKDRKTFGLVCYLCHGKRSREYIETPEAVATTLTKINQQFLTNAITALEATTLIKDLISREYKKANVPAALIKSSIICEANQRMFEKFWADKYESKFLEDPSSARYDFQRALTAIDPLPLITATKKELQKKIMSSATDKQARRIVSRVNELLSFLSRDITLDKPKAGIVEIKYVTKEEFLSVVKLLRVPEHISLAFALFGSGMRLSEAMAIEKNDVKADHVNVNKQITTKMKKKLPKREKVGKAATFEFCRAELLKWAQVPDKLSFRYSFYNELTTISKISPHDLRHSHAIHLLSQGASLTQVALNLRNTIEVCQRYYTGFAHTDDTLAGLQKFTR